MLLSHCRGSGKETRTLRVHWEVHKAVEKAGIVVRVVHCKKDLTTWLRGLESSCTLIKGALLRHEVASAQRGFSVNRTQGPHMGLTEA